MTQKAGRRPGKQDTCSQPSREWQMVTADPDQLAAWAGPAIDRYLHEALPGPAGPGLAPDGDR